MKDDECAVCGSKSDLKYEDLKLLDGKIIIKNSLYYKCKKHGEEFATSEQMQELSEQINFQRKKFFLSAQ